MQNDLIASQIKPQRPGKILLRRRAKDLLAQRLFFLISLVPVLLFLAIISALLVKSWPILQVQNLWQLLSGTVWQPLKSAFGFLPFIAGTIWVTLVSLVLAVPPCLFTAIYLAEYAHRRTRAIAKPVLDLLAAIPSVVYGVWGVLAIVPLVRWIGPYVDRLFGFVPFFKDTNPTGFSILAGGVVLAVMVTPFIIAVVFEVLRTVPDGAREASLAMGATRWQTTRHAVLPHTTAGIIAGIVLGMSRSLGETMAVLMVVGNVAKMPNSIFDPAYPLPALIANNYGEMMSIPLYDSALLTAALILLVIVLFFNIISTLILRRITGKSR
jgi:phosphate transport system permease protein